MTINDLVVIVKTALPWFFVLMTIMYVLNDDGSTNARILASLFCLIAAGGCLVI